MVNPHDVRRCRRALAQKRGAEADAYLAALARSHGGRLATFDKGMAALHADVVELVA